MGWSDFKTESGSTSCEPSAYAKKTRCVIAERKQNINKQATEKGIFVLRFHVLVLLITRYVNTGINENSRNLLRM